MCTFETSLVSHKFLRRIIFALLWLSVRNGSLFIECLTIGIRSSFTYESFAIDDSFDLPISTSF